MEALSIALIFGPISFVYRFLVFLDRFFTRTRKLPFPVISIGNIAMGGRAKTPFVIWLAGRLRSSGFTPIVLTRGYGRKYKNNFEWVKDIPVDVEKMGDEPAEIAASGSVHAVLVGSERYKNAVKFLSKQTSVNDFVFILDDGFQHWKIFRDFDLVLIESADLRNKVFPWGELREHPKKINRADIVLESQKDFVKETEIQIPRGVTQLFALTTRAHPKSYFLELQKKFPQIKCIKLPDHASAQGIYSELKKHPSSSWILGDKEAIKIFNEAEFEAWRLERSIKKILFTKEYTFFRASLKLHINNEFEILEKLKKKILSNGQLIRSKELS